MKTNDLLTALLVAAIWGANFAVIEVALESFPPLLFATLRFALVALVAVAFLKKPTGQWRSVVALGVLMGLVQFGCLFLAMDGHADAGSSALLLQAQVPLTMVLAWLALREQPRASQWFGVLLCTIGLFVCLLTTGGRVDTTGFVLILVAATSFAGANLVMRKTSNLTSLQLAAWSCTIAPLPLLLLSLWTEPEASWLVVSAAPLRGWVALAFVALVATLVAFTLWGRLLSRYSAASVTPFAMAVPLFAQITGVVWLDEPFSGWDVLALTLVIVGAVICQRRRSTPKSVSLSTCKRITATNHGAHTAAAERGSRVCGGGPAWEFYARSR